MKSKLRLLLIASALLLVFPASVFAQLNQNLLWNVNSDDQFQYVLETNIQGTLQYLDSISIEITDSLPQITHNITSWDQIPVPVFSIKYTNGSDLNTNTSIWTLLPSPFLPIGNWTLLSNLLPTKSAEDFDLEIDNLGSDVWSYSFKQNASATNLYYYCGISYDKNNGVLRKFRIETIEHSSHTLTDTFLMKQPNTTETPNFPYYLIYLGASIIGLAVIAIFVRRID